MVLASVIFMTPFTQSAAEPFVVSLAYPSNAVFFITSICWVRCAASLIFEPTHPWRINTGCISPNEFSSL